jgi:Tfp pilus assembly protein PilX
LVFLTIIGISATNTSIFESQIVGNEHRYQIDFYLADSGWQEAAMWMEGLADPPGMANPGASNMVKNYGFDTVPADPPPEDLSVLAPDNNSLSQYGIPYWYQVQYLADTVVVGSDKSYRRFGYRVASNANQTQEIEVMASKIYKVGY